MNTGIDTYNPPLKWWHIRLYLLSFVPLGTISFLLFYSSIFFFDAPGSVGRLETYLMVLLVNSPTLLLLICPIMAYAMRNKRRRLSIFLALAPWLITLLLIL